ncbi:hypothetical protein [Salinimicrobium soli]|uniref:hypothetical protein n=1 Tax=Salinimicrobium soli TaxID=1254399 RepID=UPI003AAD82BF
MANFRKNIDLEFTSLDFYDNYVISRFREDVVLGPTELQELIKACVEQFDSNRFVYISKREKNYNVIPTIYLNLKEEIQNLRGIAIVTNRSSTISMAKFEQKFSKVPYEIFQEMEEAIKWAEKQVKK